ncbi:MAG: DUF3267 domain-containing protein [Oscillospiraceae bacterium]|nr:DUF3267 domain-containing protein [Oscillospiraceae bacterium]
MRTCFTLPDGYEETDYVNLYTNRRLYRALNTASFLIGAAVLAVGYFWQGFDALLALLKRGMSDYLLWILILAAGIIAFYTLHELTHGLCMRLFSGIRPHYGKKGLMLFTGSEAYFCRRDYVITALAPALLFTPLFALLTVFLKDEWFWLALGLQLANLGGIVGDVYMTGKALRQPKSALFRDSGVGVTIYTEKP